jgi:hypothetical protein
MLSLDLISTIKAKAPTFIERAKRARLYPDDQDTSSSRRRNGLANE